MRILPLLLLAALAGGCATAATASTAPAPQVLDARRERPTTFDAMLEDLATVPMVYVGESHTNPEHKEIQRRIVEALSARNPRLVIGLEMVQAPYQEVLDRWSAGSLPEDAFLREVNWFGQWSVWDLCAPTLRLARDRHLKVVGLHLPALGPGGAISRAIAKSGLEGIPPWMRLQLPEGIDTSNRMHRRAVREALGSHPGMDEDRFQRTYEAQCCWDETFAEHAVRALEGAGPGAAIVVLAGSMHVKGFVAVPERARRRNGLDYRVVLPVEREEYAKAAADLGPGRAADYLIPTGPSRDPTSPVLGVVLRGGDALVKEVAEGGAAAAAGMRAGDVLVGIEGFAVRDSVDVRLALEGRRPGESVRIRWLRDGAPGEGSGALQEPPNPFAPPKK